MKLVSVETPEKSVCKMTFSATAEELEAASNAVYERTRASYTIKGFAKGEADRAQIEADRGEHTFWYDAINDLMDRDVPALYEAAMAEHGFKAVDEPSYDLVSVKKDEGFVATATTPLQPELNLTQTTGFHVECVTPAVTDKEIDAVLERRRNAAAELVPHKARPLRQHRSHRLRGPAGRQALPGRFRTEPDPAAGQRPDDPGLRTAFWVTRAARNSRSTSPSRYAITSRTWPESPLSLRSS
mgnify:CR=1 FL=1